MSTAGTAEARWPRVWRLVGMPQLGGNWVGWMIIIIIIGIIGAIGAASFSSKANDHVPLVSAELLPLFTYLLYMLTGPINNNWRALPVTATERRTAAWVHVSLVPMLLGLLSTIFTVLMGELVLHIPLLRLAPAIFGVQAVLLQLFALSIVLLANWPDSMAWFWTVSHRQLRDWLVAFLFTVTMLIGLLDGGALVAIPGIGLPATALAILLCAALLPITRRYARLDLAQSETQFALPALFTGPVLRGWSGHFLWQAGFTTAITLGGALLIVVALQIIPSPLVQHQRAGDGLAILNNGPALALIPVMVGVFVANICLQYQMRQRRLLLSLPRGGLLLMITPVFTALVGIFWTVMLMLLLIPVHAAWWHYALPSIAAGVAMVYLALALNLRATRYADLLLASLAAGLPSGIIGVLIGSSFDDGPKHHDFVTPHIPLITIIACIAALLAIALCRWLIRTSRKPYRPWPLTQSRWRGA